MAATCAEKHRLKMWEVQLPCTNLVMWKVVDGQSQTRKLIGKTGGKRGKTGENGGNWGKTGNGMIFQREATWLRLWFTSGTSLSERPDGDRTTSVRRVNTLFGGLQCLLALAGLDSLDAMSNEFSDQNQVFSMTKKMAWECLRHSQCQLWTAMTAFAGDRFQRYSAEAAVRVSSDTPQLLAGSARLC